MFLQLDRGTRRCRKTYYVSSSNARITLAPPSCEIGLKRRTEQYFRTSAFNFMWNIARDLPPRYVMLSERVVGFVALSDAVYLGNLPDNQVAGAE